MSVGLTAGVQFSIALSFINASVPGDDYSFAPVSLDADAPVPGWVQIDPGIGRLTGTAPIATSTALWSVQLATFRNRQNHVLAQPWGATIN